MINKITCVYKQHFNCLIWLIAGLSVMIDGNITRLQYGAVWLSVLMMTYKYMPANPFYRKEED